MKRVLNLLYYLLLCCVVAVGLMSILLLVQMKPILYADVYFAIVLGIVLWCSLIFSGKLKVKGGNKAKTTDKQS